MVIVHSTVGGPPTGSTEQPRIPPLALLATTSPFQGWGFCSDSFRAKPDDRLWDFNTLKKGGEKATAEDARSSSGKRLWNKIILISSYYEDQ